MITRDQAVEQAGVLHGKYEGPTAGVVSGYKLEGDAVRLATSAGDIIVPRRQVSEVDAPEPTAARDESRAENHGARRVAALAVELQFLLSKVQSGESLNPREIAVIRGDIVEAAEFATQTLGAEAYAQIKRAAVEVLSGKPAPPSTTSSGT